ncbi:hypothetical protein BKA69DRAFT_1032292 [Paraphysoderma sedebokerense]|nr:hypothetical protein BKA69DRAFT_1032292 [Paraphysoderma sedebokerense]
MSQQEPQYIGYPSIPGFKDFLRTIQRFNPPTRELTLRGTIKLHGTHGDICRNFITGQTWCQSRNKILTPTSDNHGFANFVHPLINTTLDTLFLQIIQTYSLVHDVTENPVTEVIVSGEWCGGSIQKGVALTDMTKCFVIFGIKINNVWIDGMVFKEIEFPEYRIFNIYQSPVFHITLNLDDVEECRKKLIEYTDLVEKECPFAKRFGVSGIGEGLVWVWMDKHEDEKTWFKTKGEKHTVSNVKTIKPLTAKEIEQLKQVGNFAKASVTENRLNQGLDYLREQNLEVGSMKNVGVFIAWVIKDVLKEGLDPDIPIDVQKLKKEVGNEAKRWYVERCS